MVCLFGQEREGIYTYLNQGNGQFTEKALYQFPPSYGSTAFELIDLNQDGFQDIVNTGGDNADFPENPPKLRPYHGIRILLNNGSWQFKEVFFFPMNGVYRFEIGDFDSDQLPDIAAVAYFADYYQKPEEGFVVLYNKGNWNYQPVSFDGVSTGRWLVLESGDPDQDDDSDIILGAALAGMSSAPPELETRWTTEMRALAFLRNSLVLPKNP